MSRWVVLAAPLLSLAALPAADSKDPPAPKKSAALMKLPEGFRVELVAGEPDLIKPIAMTTDEKGRLWVVESHSYPHWLKKDGEKGRDRVLIITPKGEGKYETKVFLDNGVNLSGIAVGFGGVYLCSVPRLIYVPVKDDKPAGGATVLLDGWNLHDTKHNVVNGLDWGPDGWLYGLNGIQSRSLVGRPGTRKEERVPFDCGVWRFHPVTKKFEVVAWGTTNPWGMDWDEHGEMFITNCVIKHAFHVVPGAHFVRMYGQDVNPHTYALIESTADHIHWGGGHWTEARGGKKEHSAAGGGHAHAGAMFYLGDNWPKEYRNRLLMFNLHGNRVNTDRVVRAGSGYTIKHAEDFLLANDDWFRGLQLKLAPDGGVYISDWHDTGECHNYDKTHPSGRVYKVTYGTPKHEAVDLGKLSDEALLELAFNKNDWHARTARRLLHERAAGGTLDKNAPAKARKNLGRANVQLVSEKLNSLWTIHAVGDFSETFGRNQFFSTHEQVRTWAVRLLADRDKLSALALNQLVALARADKSAMVRLAVTSALQKLPVKDRWRIAEALVGHGEDANDPYIPLMIWYGIEPAIPTDPDRAAKLIGTSKIPIVRKHIARRLTADEKAAPLAALIKLLASSSDAAAQADVLGGLADAFAGRRGVKPPEGWAAIYTRLAASKNDAVRDQVTALSMQFGDAAALAAVRKAVADAKAPADRRARALLLLLDNRAAGTPALLRQLLDDDALRRPAIRGLARYEEKDTPALLLKRYARFDADTKADAISTLVSRPAYALALLEAMEKKQVPTADLSSVQARQVNSFKDKAVRDKLASVWGTIRPPSKDLMKQMARYTKLATPEQRKRADVSNGRAVWARTCAQCHMLFGEGGKVGPDLTGSQRANAEYVLTKVLDPNGTVPYDYVMTRLVTTRGRILMGLVTREDDKVVTLQLANETIRLQKSDIEERERTKLSMMPEGQLNDLPDGDVRDLLAYLAAKGQVALPKKAGK